MKLTGSVNYAIGILLQVVLGAEESPLTAARIARGCRFPPRFLYRILRRLVDAGLLEGTSGPGGGYRLAKSLKAITLFDVVAAVDAPPEPSRLRPVKASHQPAIDRVNKVCAASAEQFTRDLRGLKLADLMTAQKKPKGKPAKKRRAAKSKVAKRR